MRKKNKRVQLAAGLVALATVSSIALATPAQAVEAPHTNPVHYSEDAEKPFYTLTESERAMVEATVMSEAGYETFAGQMAVAQCILNGCKARDVRPETCIKMFQYACPWEDEVSESVQDAVSAVFDLGYTVTDDEIIYFYSPRWMPDGYSAFHESQRFSMELGGHRFFEEAKRG